MCIRDRLYSTGVLVNKGLIFVSVFVVSFAGVNVSRACRATVCATIRKAKRWVLKFMCILRNAVNLCSTAEL